MQALFEGAPGTIVLGQNSQLLCVVPQNVPPSPPPNKMFLKGNIGEYPGPQTLMFQVSFLGVGEKGAVFSPARVARPLTGTSSMA